MAITHNYLETAGFKPTAAETTKAELVVNLTDGTLWSENGAGTVIQIGGNTLTGGTGISIATNAINHDSHTGDVTGSTALTIGANKVLTSHILNANVTLAKIQNIATDTFIGRTTAGTGVPETLSKTAALAILNVEDGAEANNISDVNAGLLTGAADTTLHFHSADRSRANHTGTQAHTTITGLGTAATVDTGTTSGTIPLLDGSNKIPSTLLPAIALTDVHSVASEVAQLALTVQEGDVAVRTDLSETYIHNGGVAGTMADWTLLQTPTGTATALGYTASATQGEVTNNTGSNAIIPAANGTNAGLLLPAGFNKLSFITVTQAVDLDTMESNIATNNGKVSNVNTSISTGTRTGTTYPVNLDGGGSYSYLVASGTLAGMMPAADKVKSDFITVTQAVNLDTMESNQVGSLLTGEAV